MSIDRTDQDKAGTLAEMNGGKLAALAAGLIPSIKAACVRFWLALSFVRFLEYAEQNRLKTRGFCAAGSVRIMWGGTLHFFENLKTPSRQSTSTQHPNRKSVLNPKMLSEMSS